MSGALAALAGFGATAALGGVVLWACGSHDDDDGTTQDRTTSVVITSTARNGTARAPSTAATSAAPTGTTSAAPPAPTAGDLPAYDAPWEGPSVGALAVQTPVYATPEFSKKRLGYMRYGARAPAEAAQVKNASCKQGWYKLVEGGYICGKYATSDMQSAQLKLGIVAPALQDILPYKYAYNAGHGTPLYRAMPSREDMLRYEPYLEAAKKAKREKEREKEDEAARAAASAPAPSPSATDAPAAPPETPAPAATPDDETTKPWWEQAKPGKPLDIKLSDLDKERDGTMAKRMVRGFFVAVDRVFGWNSRSWYKTTSGLIAPADRMLITKPPASKGVEVPAGVKQVGFFLASKGTKFEWDEKKKQVKVLGHLPKQSGFGLTGAVMTYKDVVYRQTTEGWWMKEKEGTWTEPGPAPKELTAGERWIDVNLTRKTLLAFEGDRPVFAALVSPGKRSKVKAKDHGTVKGTFRIREKHLAVTMDGDGTAAGDLPYSIEDVPFVQYFEGSYALHAAFWHSDFGRERSHGCVNLSPLDAKWVFFWSEPRLPRGWHGVWATPEKKGSLVVVHD